MGTELLLGEIVNTDARDVAQALSALGIDVYWHSVVGDNPRRLQEAVEIAAGRADVIITTGGLGPTYDDLTKETLARCFGLELEFHPEQAEHIREMFAARGREMTENNLRQAMLPRGCTVLHNYNGTAPGAAFEARGIHVLMLPGPPGELRKMLETGAVPYLRALSEDCLISHDVRVFGMGESAVEHLLHETMETLHNPSLAPYAQTGEVRLRITAKAPSAPEAEALCLPVLEQLREKLGDYVYAVDESSLEALCLRLLKERGMTVTAAESCTGGLIAKRITDCPGASAVFPGGVVSYCNAVKAGVVGVKRETLTRYGAVSRETALEMAEGVRRLMQADVALSATGLSGPDGDGSDTPVGSGFVAIAWEGGSHCRPIQMGGDRDFGRHLAASHAFDLLRRHLQGMSL